MSTEDEDVKTARRQIDHDDLQREIAGVNGSRIARFLTVDDSVSKSRREKEDQAVRQTRLMIALMDAAYREAFTRAWDTLEQAERAAEAALQKLERQIAEAEDDIRDMERQAARVPGGEMVFKDANGQVRYADGRKVEDHLAETVLWTGDEPTFEDYVGETEKLDNLRNAKTETEIYRDEVLGEAREELSDPDNPPSRERLEEITDKVKTRMPSVVAAEIEPDTGEMAAEPTANLAIPKLGD